MKSISDYIWIGLAVFIIIDLMLLAWVVYRRSRGSVNEELKKKIGLAWKNILSEQTSKYQVLEAAKVVEQVIRSTGFQGGFGDYLKKHGARFSNLNGVWSALKLRNKIAHELSAQPGKSEINLAIKQFERALKDFKVLK